MPGGHPPRRRLRWSKAFGVAAAAVLAAACGQPGPPLPPSANLPRLVRNFSARRLGGQVHLAWTVPQFTTDGVRIHQPVSVSLCVWPGLYPGVVPPVRQLCPRVLKVTPTALPTRIPPQLTIALTRLLPPAFHGDFVGLAVEFVNQRAQGAGWSSFQSIPLTPVAPPPVGVRLLVYQNGTEIRWTLPSTPHPVAVYRQRLDASGKPVASARLLGLVAPGQTRFLDTTTVWKRTYRYWLRSVAGQKQSEVESEDSALVEVTPRDVFPPAVPQALQAVLSAGIPAVDLSWEPVSAPDLAGYRVYRRSPNRAWQLLSTGLLLTPVFRDPAPPSGTVEYAVTAVDHAGNQSPLSAPVSVVVPAHP